MHHFVGEEVNSTELSITRGQLHAWKLSRFINDPVHLTIRSVHVRCCKWVNQPLHSHGIIKYELLVFDGQVVGNKPIMIVLQQYFANLDRLVEAVDRDAAAN